MNAVRKSSPIDTAAAITRLTLTADIPGGVKAELTADQITIEVGSKNSIIVERSAWREIIAKSAILDAILAGEPLPAPSVVTSLLAPELEDVAGVGFYPEIGARIGGGFCAGRHPTEDGAVLVVAGIDGDADEVNWSDAVAHCESYRKDEEGDWRLPTRLEALLCWERLGFKKTGVAAFKAGSEHALAQEAHWTGEIYEFDSGDAWSQAFGHGTSHYYGKYNELRARPVRIILI